jgi:hypothetical protein
MIAETTPETGSALVGAETLLETLFPAEKDRPTLRWLATMRQRRVIPFHKIGGRIIRYDVAEVRAAIDRNFAVPARDIEAEREPSVTVNLIPA